MHEYQERAIVTADIRIEYGRGLRLRLDSEAREGVYTI